MTTTTTMRMIQRSRVALGSAWATSMITVSTTRMTTKMMSRRRTASRPRASSPMCSMFQRLISTTRTTARGSAESTRYRHTVCHRQRRGTTSPLLVPSAPSHPALRSLYPRCHCRGRTTTSLGQLALDTLTRTSAPPSRSRWYARSRRPSTTPASLPNTPGTRISSRA